MGCPLRLVLPSAAYPGKCAIRSERRHKLSAGWNQRPRTAGGLSPSALVPPSGQTLRFPAQGRAAIFDYIEVFYNRQRRHQTLIYLSPAQFERQVKVA